MTPSFTCPWCAGGEVGASYEAVELLLGTREAFRYTACAGCGSLAIDEPPPDLGRFYPPGYYSMAEPPTYRGSSARAAARRARTRVGSSRLVPRRWVATVGGVPAWMASLRPLPTSSRILDVGSGAGRLVSNLRRMGFASAVGVDPHCREGSSTTIRAELGDLDGEFDVVLFHHSLEHVRWPRESLSAARRLLEPRAGRLVVRLPVVDSEPWRTYGVAWAGLDAPRHLAIPTSAGLRAAVEWAGFRVRHWGYDATGFGWWGSELYRAGVALDDPEAVVVVPPERRAHFERVAAAANEAGTADNVVVILDLARG